MGASEVVIKATGKDTDGAFFVAEIVLDLMKAAIAHTRKYRHTGRTAPWAERLIRTSRQSHTARS